ncbi:MAG: hypothetical protein K0R73_321 [Candidatus Midichloriaceae bacterium]|jgi:ATPase subunit of ABC transporter with duplicated ATPase domains|nr:hypothetical protein [Candidatus Midichloriaceae bacterium]
MIHKPIQIKGLSLSFPHKTCFENFNCEIAYGSRIAIIGKNGSGKSTLLKIIAGLVEPSWGAIMRSQDVTIGYVPQVVEDHSSLSGGERLNNAMTEALSLNPNILLLDEPTNHLDLHNRKGLIRMLQNYPGTLIIASHDVELLRNCIDTLWHIDNGKVHIFSGNYDDYIGEIKQKRASIKAELEFLTRQKKDMHNKLMQEQKRAAKSKAKGKKSMEHNKWPNLIGKTKALQGEKTSGHKKSAIDKRKSGLTESLDNLLLPEIIIPKFSIESADIGNRMVIQISGGSIGYFADKPLLSEINLSLYGGERIAITGDNGSGKSTLIKAILGDESIYKSGEWYVIKREDIGYLDQHYSTLDPNKSVLETMLEFVPNWPHAEIRRHLNDFLFRKNEEVNAPISTLSGGEKARLCLAQIAAKTPKLLILDEITNNLDLETREHVIQVLKSYPGAMIVISHDADFLEEIGVAERMDVSKFRANT